MRNTEDRGQVRQPRYWLLCGLLIIGILLPVWHILVQSPTDLSYAGLKVSKWAAIILIAIIQLSLFGFSWTDKFKSYIEKQNHYLKLGMVAGSIPALFIFLYAGDPTMVPPYNAILWQTVGLWFLPIWLVLWVISAEARQVYKSEITISIISLIIAATAAELAARYWLNHYADIYKRSALLPSSYFRYEPHAYLNYSPSPGYNNEFDQINSLGYRGEEFSATKPENTFRIAAIGGSTTYGAEVGWADSYPAQLQQILREDYGYTHVEVINAGVPGYTTWESLSNLTYRVIDLEPDLVLVYHNTNDVHARLVPPDDYRSDNSGYRQQWDETKTRSLSNVVPSVLLRMLEFRFGLVEVLTVGSLTNSEPCCLYSEDYNETLGMTPMEALERNPPIYYERNLRNMVAIARANQSEIVFIDWVYRVEQDHYVSLHHYQVGFAQHNEVMHQLGDELDVLVIPLSEEFQDDNTMWGDNLGGVHMSAKGNHQRANIVAKYLIEAGLCCQPDINAD